MRPKLVCFGLVLLFSSNALAVLNSNSSAIGVLGQSAAQNSDASPVYTKGCKNNGASQIGFDQPNGLTFDTTHHRLFVADCRNNRVLVFGLTSGDLLSSKVPVNVLGQSDFTSCESKITASRFNCPVGVAYDSANDRLFVSDNGNSRVLVFDTATISDGESAVNVLGQPDFTSGAGGTTQSTLSYPGPIALDSTNNRLWVTDSANHRVVFYNTSSITNGMNASNVLGQTNFTNSSSATTQSRMTNPWGVAADPANNRLFVGTAGPNWNGGRVMVYDTTTITNGMNATYALGKANFTSTTCGTSQSAMCDVENLAYDPVGNRLFVADLTYRVMVFNTSSITTGMNASYVLGQSSFTVRNWQGGAEGIQYALGLAFDATNGRLLVADNSFHRILFFDVTTMTDGQNAIHVLGQSNFTNNSAATTQAGQNTPNGTAFDPVGNRVFVADTTNNRVLVYDASSFSNGMNASKVLGQANFTSNSSATTQSGMNQPKDVYYDSTNLRLFVSDFGNSRVLVFNVSSGITDGMNAANVLGQSDFTSGSSSVSSSRLNGPVGLAYDGTNLFVADSGNHRVLRFDVSTITDGEAAGYVLGQTNFTNSGTGLSQSRMNTPLGLAYDSGNARLFVADSANNRTLSYNVGTISNGMNANRVMGQADYISSGAATTQAGMSAPKGVAFDSHSDRLFVSDSTNNRILIFDTATITNGENAVKVLGQADFTSGSSGTTQSTLNSPLGMSFDDSNFRLYVADSANHRTMRFAGHDLENLETAIDLLGQYTSLSSTSQVDYNTDYINNYSTNPYGFYNPSAIAMDPTRHRLFVADSENHRVLIYNLNTDNSLPDRVADQVLGQSSLFDYYWLSSNAGGVVTPNSLALDQTNNRLYVADCNSYTSRVMVFDLSTITDGMNAAYVLGQPDFDTLNSPGTSQSVMNYACGVAYDSANSRVFVADQGNHRVLVYNTTTLSNGMNASYVLGQANFTDNTYSTGQARLDLPGFLAFDPIRNHLYVSDNGNSRIMIFDTSSLSNGMNAAFVLGQPDFTSTGGGLSQTQFNSPQGIALDAWNKRLFVADELNHRVLMFDVTKITNGMNASKILGQSDFVSNTYDVTQSKFKSPYGLLYDPGSGRLFVTEYGNFRILIFEASYLPAFN